MPKGRILLFASFFFIFSCDTKTKAVSSCGDGFLDPDEECDLTVGENTCRSLGHYNLIGQLACNADCSFNRTDCLGRCGDLLIDADFGEECDGENLNGQSCLSLGYGSGDLACSSDCRLISDDCSGACGNGLLEENEACDDLNDDDGDGCSAACQIEDGWRCNPSGPSVCSPVCQDGMAVGVETCDMQDLNGHSCEELGYHGGELSCTTTCELNIAPCVNAGRCGDAIVQIEFEECEENQLNDQTCQTIGYGGGTLNCSSDCGLDSTQCAGGCAGAIPITIPYSIMGNDFAADYPYNFFVFSDPSCDTGYPGRGTDVVFSVDLAANEGIILMLYGGLDGQLFIQRACDPIGVCEEAVNDFETDGMEEILFRATETGTFFIIVKAYEQTPTSSNYIFSVGRLEVPTELSCGDGFDNDRDGLSDCGDPDCFGIVGACENESFCSDFQDNDGDLALDCFDSDCAGVDPCGMENTAARCIDGRDNDADGTSDCSDSDCDTFSSCIPGQTCFTPIAITSLPFNRAGDNFQLEFPENRTFTNIVNGCTTAFGPEAVFSIDLQAGERIILTQDGTMDSVIRVLPDCTDTGPICLENADDPGTLSFTAPNDGTYYLILEKYGASLTPIDYDFTVTAWPYTETSCTDGIDNDRDGKTDCSDEECTASCSIIFNENFNNWPLTNWTIYDGGTVGQTWFNSANMSPLKTRTLNGSTGTFAVVDSDAAGLGVTFDDQLVSPNFNCSGYTSVYVSFRHYRLFTWFYGVENTNASLYVTSNNGANWSYLSAYLGPENGTIEYVDISSWAAGQANVRILFRYSAPSVLENYWLIDDLIIYGR